MSFSVEQLIEVLTIIAAIFGAGRYGGKQVIAQVASRALVDHKSSTREIVQEELAPVIELLELHAEQIAQLAKEQRRLDQPAGDLGGVSPAKLKLG